MKRFAALILALAVFAAPMVALADVDSPGLSEIFDRYEETILVDEGE
ncbi:MAG: hypothetical protein ACE5FB_03765 [Candidatus Binatia bacterium]